MPPHSTGRSDEEGVLIDRFSAWWIAGSFREAEETRDAADKRRRTRRAIPHQNIGRSESAGRGLRQKGVQELHEDGATSTAATWCKPTCSHVQDNAEEAVRRALSHLALDDGAFALPIG